MVNPNIKFYYKYSDGCDGNVRLNQINYDEYKQQLENLMKLTPSQLGKFKYHINNKLQDDWVDLYIQKPKRQLAYIVYQQDKQNRYNPLGTDDYKDLTYDNIHFYFEYYDTNDNCNTLYRLDTPNYMKQVLKIASHRAAKPILHVDNYCGLQPHGDFIVEEPVPEAIYIIDGDGKTKRASYSEKLKVIDLQNGVLDEPPKYNDAPYYYKYKGSDGVDRLMPLSYEIYKDQINALMKLEEGQEGILTLNKTALRVKCSKKKQLMYVMRHDMKYYGTHYSTASIKQHIDTMPDYYYEYTDKNKNTKILYKIDADIYVKQVVKIMRNKDWEISEIKLPIGVFYTMRPEPEIAYIFCAVE